MKNLEAAVYDIIYYHYINGRQIGRTSIEVSEELELPKKLVQYQLRKLLDKNEIVRNAELNTYIPAEFKVEPVSPPSRPGIKLEFEKYSGEYREHPERDPLQHDNIEDL